MKNHVKVSLLPFSLLVLISMTIMMVTNHKTVSAEPYATTQCNVSGSTAPNWNSSDDKVYVYIADDFAEKMSWCLVNSHADDLSEVQARNVVMSAAEVWNRESRGAVLQYAGTKNFSRLKNNCSSFSNTPAVYVRFHNGCGTDMCATIPASRRGIVSDDAGCNEVLELIIYGDINSMNTCDNSNGGLVDWTFDGLGGLDIITALVHEFGHVLGLHHSDLSTNNITTNSIMRSAPLSNNMGRHLYPWEMDCVDDQGTGTDRRTIREVEYNWIGIDDEGDFISSVQNIYPDTFTKDSISGTVLRTNSLFKHALYSPDKEIWTDDVGTDGVISFGEELDFSGTETSDLFISPVLFSAFEKTGSYNNQRINYNYVTLSTDFPPLVKYKRSDNFFINSYSLQYEEKTGSGNVPITSHVPFVAAWDEVSDNTVFVGVDTNINSATHGDIIIYPGFDNSSSYVLREGVLVSDNRTPPSDSYTTKPSFNYMLKTDVTPSVSCAPNGLVFTYNCLLAWQDKGVPDAKVLYTYFRINPSTDVVEWMPGTINVWVRSGSATVGGVSTAYFEGKFWMAWRNTDSDSDVVWTSTSSTTGWSSVVELGRTLSIGSPTWSYHPTDQSSDRALIWTER